MAVYAEPVRSDFWQLARDSSGQYIDRWGPIDCGTHGAARAIMRALEGQKPANLASGVAWPPNGEYIRSVTREPDGDLDRSGGVNLSQMKAVALSKYGVVIAETRRLPWTDFLDIGSETRGWMLAVGYNPIARTAFDAGRGFGNDPVTANHMLYGNAIDRSAGKAKRVIDSLAGPANRTGIYHGPGDYPLSLLKVAAGALNVSSDPRRYVPLGTGLVYVGFTKATGEAPGTVRWQVSLPDGDYFRYFVNSSDVITGRIRFHTGGMSPLCTAPDSKDWPGHPDKSLVKLLNGARAGQWVAAEYARRV